MKAGARRRAPPLRGHTGDGRLLVVAQLESDKLSAGTRAPRLRSTLLEIQKLCTEVRKSVLMTGKEIQSKKKAVKESAAPVAQIISQTPAPAAEAPKAEPKVDAPLPESIPAKLEEIPVEAPKKPAGRGRKKAV